MFTKKVSARMLAVAGATALVLGATSGIQAATDTANLSVTATVTANCTITTSAVAFGAYDPIDVNSVTDRDNSGTLSVTCTDGASATVTLGQGASADTGSTDADPTRRMSDGGTNFLGYSLFTDAGRSDEWGNTGVTGVAYVGTGASENLTVYGRIPAGQAVPAASYSDTVVATITF